MYKIGLKLWSINTDYYYDEAIRLYNDGVFDYIELYVVPNTTDTIEKWKKLDIPFTLHAPHFAHDVNLACEDKLEYNKKIYAEVAQFEKELAPKYTVVHGGIEGTIEELVRQLKIIQPKNILIENKPYRAPLGEKKLCRGYNIEEIKYVLDNYDCGFCLDIGHAICSANSLSIDPYEYVSKFNELKPTCYHLSDGYIDSSVDKHLHIGSGTYDINKILNIIGNKKTISIETNKDSKENLDDFLTDVRKIDTNSNLKGFVFDLDDTLYPQKEYTRDCLHNCSSIISEYSMVSIENINTLLDEILDLNGIEYKHIFDDLFEKINFDGKPFLPEILSRFKATKPIIKLYPKVKNLLETLKLNYELGLITDGPINNQKYKIDVLNLKSTFDEIIFTDAFGIDNRKPSIRGFKEYLKEALLNPKRCIYVGNDPYRDFRPASSVGMKTIRINQGDYKNIKSLDSVDYEFNSIEELFNNIGEIE